ncbi:MAG TPA: MarR family winged helix-turn-helix transcriptional regulator [Chloroflexia bacterium]|nr:MarR family winged helix-turn-helix transcriptional regulator [Chloroflexia bacterium]
MSNESDAPTEATVNFAAMCANFNIRKAARAVTSFYDAMLQPTGMRSTQGTLLMALSLGGSMTISRLAESLVMDRTTLARDLKPLEEQGLVRIAPGADRRTRQLELTKAGRDKLREIIPLWEQAQAKIIGAGLGQDRWRQLHRELQEVIRLAQE